MKQQIKIDDKTDRIEMGQLGFIQFQNGPVKDNGVNGLSMVDMLVIIVRRLERLNAKHGDIHNENAIMHLNLARNELRMRHQERVERGVEGYDKD